MACLNMTIRHLIIVTYQAVLFFNKCFYRLAVCVEQDEFSSFFTKHNVTDAGSEY